MQRVVLHPYRLCGRDCRHGGGGFQFHPRSAALIQSLPPVPSLASIENAYQADLAKRGTAHANAAQAEKMKVQHCRFELYGPELMSIEQLQRAVHRAVHESAQRHNSKTTGTTAAEIEASIVSRLTDAMVATLVVDAEVGPAVQLNAPHDHQTSFDFSSSDESDEHEDAGPQQFGELGLPPSQLAFEAVVDGVVQALEANPALSLQRIGAAARALHLKGHRVDFRHLAIDENAKALLVRGNCQYSAFPVDPSHEVNVFLTFFCFLDCSPIISWRLLKEVCGLQQWTSLSPVVGSSSARFKLFTEVFGTPFTTR